MQHSPPRYYEQRLLLGLPWYCPHSPVVLENGDLEWTFCFDLHVAGLDAKTVVITYPKCSVSFETLSAEIEKYIGSVPNLICDCCLLEDKARCKSCLYAIGLHQCEKKDSHTWRKGTLHDGPMDFQRVVWNLHRRGVPMPALKKKADEFIASGDLSVGMAETIIKTIEAERGKQRLVNQTGGEATDGDRAGVSDQLNLADMQKD